MSDLSSQIVELLRQASSAHHQFETANGKDEDWPLWYAEYLLQPLSEVTGFKFTKSELTYVLVHLSKEQPVKGPTVEWPVYYADYIAEHYTHAT